MKNKTIILRAPKSKENHYTRISNDVIGKKSNLTFEEKGLLVTLLSLPKNYIIHKEDIRMMSPMSTNKFNRIWNSLKKQGYIEIIPIQGKGMPFGYKYIIKEIPTLGFPASDFPASENPASKEQERKNKRERTSKNC